MIPSTPVPGETDAETKERILHDVTEEQRHAALNAHIRETLDKAQHQLRAGKVDAAMTTIAEASAKYTRFGGPPGDPMWVPANEREAAE